MKKLLPCLGQRVVTFQWRLWTELSKRSKSIAIQGRTVVHRGFCVDVDAHGTETISASELVRLLFGNKKREDTGQ